jgi:hypothetical protein
MTQTKFGAACRSEINTFYRVRLSQPLLEILIFLGIVYISDLALSTCPLESKPMKDSSHVDRFVISYRGSTCKLRAEAATLCDAVMARNRFFNINYINCTINMGPGPTNSNVDNFGVY